MLNLRQNLITLWLLFNLSCFAQNDTARANKWYSPEGISLEYAGGFGMFSGGILFTPFLRTDLIIFAGYTPPRYGDILTAGISASYVVIQKPLSKNYKFNILKAGAFISSAHGANIHMQWPSIYPDDYYWWNSSLRYGPFVETELVYLPAYSDYLVSAFYQVLTNDLYLYSYLPNTKHLSVADIIFFGCGIRIKKN